MNPRNANDVLAEELHRHRHDPDEWSEEAVPIEVRPSQMVVVSCRLPTEEFRALEEAAKAANESISEFVREAIRLRHIADRSVQAHHRTADAHHGQGNSVMPNSSGDAPS